MWKYTIKFDGCDEYSLPMFDQSDESIEAARQYAERLNQGPLLIDPRTDYPNFTIYSTDEVAGG